MVALHHPHTVSDVLTDLRQATASAHQTLEARLPFLHPDFNLPRYTGLLKAYYGFYLPLEQALCALPLPAELAFQERRKSAALAADLRALGLSSAEIDHLPTCQQLPPMQDSASAFGVLYVLEGATLGGQVLLRAVRNQLQLGAENGAAFLDVYGAATGQRWRAFLELLAGVTQPDLRQRCVQAACATFTLFQAWLDNREVLNDA
jgi:heme oxygenase